MKELNNDELNLKLLSALLEEIYGEEGVSLSEAEYYCLGFCHELNLNYAGTDSLLETLNNINEIIETTMNEDKSDIIIKLNKDGIELIETAIEQEISLDIILNEAGKKCKIAKDVEEDINIKLKDKNNEK